MSVKVPTGPVASWIKLLGALVLIPAVGWGIAVERRITKIEASRFTTADGMKMYQRIGEKADKSNVPPPDVRQMLELLQENDTEIKRLLEKLDDTLDEHIAHHNGGDG